MQKPLTPTFVAACKTASSKTLKINRLAHSESERLLGISVLLGSLELVADGDIEVTGVLFRGLGRDLANNLLALGSDELVGDVEDGLLPVGVLGVGTGGKAEGLVAGGELNIEPRDEGMDVVVALDVEGELSGERELLNGDGVEINRVGEARLGDNSLELDGIDQRFRERDLLHGGVVEAIDVVPD